jgi:hypothetical protein
MVLKDIYKLTTQETRNYNLSEIEIIELEEAKTIVMEYNEK